MIKHNSRKKIYFLIPRLGISDRGAEIMVYELAKRLKDSFEITIFTRAGLDSFLIRDLLSKKIQIFKINSFSAQNKYILKIYKINLLQNFFVKFMLNPDEMEMLIFSLFTIKYLIKSDKNTAYFPVNGFWGVLACKVIKKFTHSFLVYSSQGGIEPMIARLNPDIYFVVNKEIQKFYNKYFPKLQTSYVPMGVDISYFSKTKKKAKIKLNKPIVGVVSAFIKQKRIDLTIKAVAKTKKYSLLIIGQGQLLDDIKSLCNKYLPGRYLITNVPYNKIAEYYRAIDVFTLASPQEPFGMVYIEAMASGIPVVLHEAKTQRGIMGKEGIYCDVYKTNDYAKTLKIAYAKSKNKNYRKVLKKQATSFSWEKIAKKYLDELSNLVNEKI